MKGNQAPWFRWPVLVALALMLATDALGGPIRYGLAPLGLVGLSYAPFLVAAAVIAAYALAQLGLLRFDTVALFLLLISALWLPYALLLGLSLQQVAFGYYTWMPVFLGTVIVAVGVRNEALRMIEWLWGVAVLGVFANLLFRFPWVGESYEILGVRAEFAREWQAFGVERLPGFSRASFSAANQIAIAGCLLVAGPLARRAKLIVWLLSVAAIALTTSKAPLAAMMLAPLCLHVYDRLEGRRRFGFSQSMIGLMLVAAIGLPLAALLGFRLGESGNLAFLSLGSIGVRMDEMWPRAYALLDPLWPRLVFGLGFGGIGAGQAYFDPVRFSPGDNLFVFLYATFGIASVFFLAAFWRGNAPLFRLAPAVHREVFLIAVLVLVLGAMANVVESVVSGVLLGLLVGKSLHPIAAIGGVEVSEPAPLSRPGVGYAAPVRI